MSQIEPGIALGKPLPPAEASSRPGRGGPWDVVLLLAGCVYVATTSSYLSQPLLDLHSFRQCQTAISVPWLAEDLDPRRMLVYETPILGAPWRVPFELPLYQWCAAVLHRATGWSVELSCRSVALAFHLACLWPLWRLVRLGGGSARTWKILASLFLLAPVLHHWSRTALIETTAVYLSLEFLASMAAWSCAGGGWRLAVASAWATLAVLVKVTTFPPFAAAAGLICLRREWLAFVRDGRVASAVGRLAVAGAPLAVALAFLVPWLRDCDAIKRCNPIAAYNTSAGLAEWNYGTALQRVSTGLWVDTVLLRAVPEAVGWPGLVVLAAGLVALVQRDERRRALVALLLGGLFLLPFVLFTNLHMVHNYYQAANAVWLVAALAVVLDRIADWRPRELAVGLLVISLAGQFQRSMQGYIPMEGIDFSRDARLAVARTLRNKLTADGVVLFVGCDWSPEIAFYARRRAVYIPQWVKFDDVAGIVADPDRVTGGQPIEAMVIWNNSPCMAGDPRWDPRTTAPLLGLAERIGGGHQPERISDFLVFTRTAAAGHPSAGAKPE